MPHIIVKLQAGRSEAQKQAIADAVTRAITETASCADASVSVAIEDIDRQDWTDKVYRPDIAAHWDRLYKKPDYRPG